MSTINDIGMNRAYVRYRNLEKLNFIINEDLADKLNIEAIPYALYIDKQGKVVAKGVVNNYENLIGLREIARKAELAAV
jgi:hypothetical protein